MINDFYCGLPGTNFFVYLGMFFWDCLQTCKMKKVIIIHNIYSYLCDM